MTTPYNPRTPINELHDMIDKHVPQAEARLQIHYDKAAETRALLKRLGCWPAETKHKAQPPRKKAEGHGSVSLIARMAYDWARKHDKTTNEAAEEFRISPDAIHSFRQYRKLPKLKR